MFIQCAVCKKFLMGGFWINYKIPEGSLGNRVPGGSGKLRISSAICPSCSRSLSRGFRHM